MSQFAILIDDAKQHYMQSHLFDDEYVMLVWPKNTSLKHLEHAKEIVNFQLDCFVESAKRDEPRKEYARIEVESWNVQP